MLCTDGNTISLIAIEKTNEYSELITHKVTRPPCAADLKVLKGHSKGLYNGDLARLLNESRTNINRTLPLMIEEGVVEQCHHGYYKLGEQLLQIALAYLDEADRAQIKVTEQRLRCVSSALKP